MPTPSSSEKARDTGSEGAIHEVSPSRWEAQPETAPRSVFGNFGPSPACVAAAGHDSGLLPGAGYVCLQEQINQAIGRTFLYSFLARAFEDPTAASWDWLTAGSTQEHLRNAVAVLAMGVGLSDATEAVVRGLSGADLEPFNHTYLAAFGHAARGVCPINEIEYGDLKADPLFQPHRLADLAGFYRAFGLAVAEEASERHDHLCMELEFMSALAAKEAYAMEFQFDPEAIQIGREAQRKFLREHLGRWVPAFTRRLRQISGAGLLSDLAKLLGEFVLADCCAFGTAAGSEDLLLRPIDRAVESLCDSCGLKNLPPGALPAAPAV